MFGEGLNRQNLDNVIEAVDQLIVPMSYECAEVIWDESEQAVTVFIDSDAGVKIDDCAKVSRVIHEDPNFNELVPDDIRIEVSTPGIERPLRKLAHFSKHISQTVALELIEPLEGQRSFKGRLDDVGGDETLVLDMEGKVVAIPHSLLLQGHLVYDWNHH